VKSRVTAFLFKRVCIKTSDVDLQEGICMKSRVPDGRIAIVPVRGSDINQDTMKRENRGSSNRQRTESEDRRS